MRIAVASGKGGTGKTTIAVNLAWFLSDSGKRVQYIDCDVEEPNGHIFLKPDITKKEILYVMIPVVDMDKCTSCGICSDRCQFRAIVNINDQTLIFPELCKSCKLCLKSCPEGAISEGKREIGTYESGLCNNGISFIHGVLRIGEAIVTPLIKRIQAEKTADRIQILDSPPGTSCPMIVTLKNSDAVVLVTEPTPFGLHDLKLAAVVALEMGKSVGLVVNRSGVSFPPLDRFIQEKNIPILASIPEDRDIAQNYSRGNIILKSLPSYREKFIRIWTGVEQLLTKEKKATA